MVWKRFLQYWPSVRESIHPVMPTFDGFFVGILNKLLIEFAGDLRRRCAHVMSTLCVKYISPYDILQFAHPELAWMNPASPFGLNTSIHLWLRACITLQWRHKERDGVSNHQPHDCFFKVQIKENIKAPRHWPMWGEFTGDQWIPCTKGH